MSINKVTIIGLGLMGGSLGMALRKKVPTIEVCGVDRQSEIVRQAEKKGSVDYGTIDLGKGVRGADLIFLATPLAVMPCLCITMQPYLKQGAIITDLGSTKEQLVKCLEEILPEGVFFLGGHPMAGSEKKGIKEARADLLENAVYILTPTTKTKVQVIDTLSTFLYRLGVRIILLSPAEHDRKIAAVSHLPHLLANALLNTVGILEEEEEGYFSLSAGGFRDTTRIADSQSEMWTEILLQNRKALMPVVKRFRSVLAEYEEALRKEDSVCLQELLEKARQRKQKNHKIMAHGKMF
ncbi:MAG TPA: prephenate dehydrogenase/arogenate dehydrogenase family protein [Clostridia bacterium]|jgi:prephenate dehydrogenase|nr:prephenate dehydrogenase/arogenate dehydrogenase family protein [Clostridia bacterium]HHY06301.1 prephenate dehydrogenase/arogenate dehydrogenase family protein [Clostridia bacterium]